MGFLGPLQVVGRCDVGRSRKQNQDYVGHRLTPAGMLLVVCDGMGGHSGGQLASRLAVETIEEICLSPPVAGESPQELLTRALEEANRRLRKVGRSDPAIHKLGSTVVVALVTDVGAYIAHVGDSRAYLQQGGHLSRLTSDHSVIQRMVDQGLLSEADAENHPNASVVSRALGQKDELEVECRPTPVPLGPGDRILLCSDGLSRMVGDPGIETLLAGNPDPERAAELLVAQANSLGGDDNVSVLIVEPLPARGGGPTGSVLMWVAAAALALSLVLMVTLGLVLAAGRSSQLSPPAPTRGDAGAGVSLPAPPSPDPAPSAGPPARSRPIVKPIIRLRPGAPYPPPATRAAIPDREPKQDSFGSDVLLPGGKRVVPGGRSGRETQIRRSRPRRPRRRSRDDVFDKGAFPNNE